MGQEGIGKGKNRGKRRIKRGRDMDGWVS